jgi:hypothetical protein
MHGAKNYPQPRVPLDPAILPGTIRVMEIKAVSETRIFPTAEKMAQILRIKQFRNPHCEKGPGICIPTDFSNGVPNWRAFHDLAARELALAAS